MKIDKRFKLHEVASTDETRPAMNGIFFDKEAGVIVATNGRAMAVVKASDCDRDTAGIFSKTAYAAAVSKDGQGIILLNGKAEVPVKDGVLTYGNDDDGLTFPDYKSVFKSHVGTKKKPVKFVTVTFNPYLLLDTARALGLQAGDSVTLSIAEDSDIRANHAIGVTVGRSENHGLIMPMRI